MNDGGVSTGGTAVWVSRRADVKDGEACKTAILLRYGRL